METKKCEVCGENKPQSEFSKSYRNRCRACVAEQTRNARHTNGHHVSTVIIDEPRIDIMTVEMRLVETAVSALIRKNDGRVMDYDCEEIGSKAVRIAHAAMRKMSITQK